jgi:hypothetical protein
MVIPIHAFQIVREAAYISCRGCYPVNSSADQERTVGTPVYASYQGKPIIG